MCSGKSEKLKIANKEFSLYIKKKQETSEKVYLYIFIS